MCYIWQEQSWELTLEVTTSHTALSQRRDNTLFGGGGMIRMIMMAVIMIILVVTMIMCGKTRHPDEDHPAL